MNIKERIEKVQDIVDELQTEISEYDKHFRFYNILIHNLCVTPMEIRIFRCENNSEPVLINTFLVDIMDRYPDTTNNLNSNALEPEFEFLRLSSAPKQQVNELIRIKKFFGI